MTTTFDRICALLNTDHRIPLDRLTPDAALEDLGIDSLGTVELLWRIEDVFQVTLPTEPMDLKNLGDVARLVDDLRARQGAKPGGAPPADPVLQAR